MKNLNEVIEPVLEDIKLSKKALAERVEFTEAGFYRVLSRNDCKVSDLERIAEVLGIPITNFFLDEKSIVQKQNEELKREKDTMRTTIENLIKTVTMMSLGKCKAVFQAVA